MTPKNSQSIASRSTFFFSSSSAPPAPARISSNDASGAALAPSSASSAPPSLSSSSGFGDFAPFGAANDAPNRVVAPEKEPKASFDLGTEPFGAGEDPNTEGLPLLPTGVPKAGVLGPGEPVDDAAAAARKGEGLDAKEEKPLDANVDFGAGEVVREGAFGVENLENNDEEPNEAKVGFQRGQVREIQTSQSAEFALTLFDGAGSSRKDLLVAPFRNGEVTDE